MIRTISGLFLMGIALTAVSVPVEAQGGDPCATMTVQGLGPPGVHTPPIPPLAFPAQGGTQMVTISAPANCSWIMSFFGSGLPPTVALNGDPKHLDILGSGSKTVSVTVFPNQTAFPRSGTLLVQKTIGVKAFIDKWAVGVTQTTPSIALSCPAGTGDLKKPYSSSLVATGGIPPYRFSIIDGALPNGLTLNTVSGAITGIPTTLGSATFLAEVADSSGRPHLAKACTILVAQCRYTIAGPSDVPGLSEYTYQINPGTAPATGIALISWAVNKSTATFHRPTNQFSAVIKFQNTQADLVTIKATFFDEGAATQCEVQKEVALVKVDVGAATFSTPGKPSKKEGLTGRFLVEPPADGSPSHWVTTFPPAADCWTPTGPNAGCWQQFTSNVTPKDSEEAVFLESAGAKQDNGRIFGEAFTAESDVTLTSPAEKPDALQKIQVGFIQGGYDTGSARYGAGLSRTVAIPTLDTVDWLMNPKKGPGSTDEWPWYDNGTARKTGLGSILWHDTLAMSDSPSVDIPKKYNPTDGSDTDRDKPLLPDTDYHRISFDLWIAARTLDTDLGADRHYFKEAHAVWEVNFVWPLLPNVGITRVFDADWQKPSAPQQVRVHVIPDIINATIPFERWKCNKPSCNP